MTNPLYKKLEQVADYILDAFNNYSGLSLASATSVGSYTPRDLGSLAETEDSNVMFQKKRGKNRCGHLHETGSYHISLTGGGFAEPSQDDVKKEAKARGMSVLACLSERFKGRTSVKQIRKALKNHC